MLALQSDRHRHPRHRGPVTARLFGRLAMPYTSRLRCYAIFYQQVSQRPSQSLHFTLTRLSSSHTVLYMTTALSSLPSTVIAQMLVTICIKVQPEKRSWQRGPKHARSGVKRGPVGHGCCSELWAGTALGGNLQVHQFSRVRAVLTGQLDNCRWSPTQHVEVPPHLLGPTTAAT